MISQCPPLSYVVVHAFNGWAIDIGNPECPIQDPATPPLEEETVVSCMKLAPVLRRIRARLQSEGYNICNGKLVKIEPKS
jgi:hypothetical protein